MPAEEFQLRRTELLEKGAESQIVARKVKAIHSLGFLLENLIYQTCYDRGECRSSAKELNCRKFAKLRFNFGVLKNKQRKLSTTTAS